MEPADFKTRMDAVNARMRARLADPTYQARRDALGEHIDEAQQREREAARVLALKRAGIPEPVIPLLAAPAEREPLAFVRGWITRAARFGLLFGEVGTGKSFALCWAVAEEPASRYSEARALADPSLQEWPSVRAGLLAAPLLAIDDLGMDALDQPGWREERFYNLVNARFNAGHRTLLAANLGPDAFWERYPDGRFYDRVTSSCEIGVFTGPSLRRRALGLVPPPD